jgi:hypothetical protein
VDFRNDMGYHEKNRGRSRRTGLCVALALTCICCIIISACRSHSGSSSENLAPTANAGSDQEVNGGEIAQLDATASSDPNGDALAYHWTQIHGIPVSLSAATAAKPTFVAPRGMTATETLIFDLRVNDGKLDSAHDTVVVSVKPVIVNAPSGFVSTAAALLSKGHFSMNNPWTQADLDYENITAAINYQGIVNTHPPGRIIARTTLMEEYLARRRQCEEDYKSLYPPTSWSVQEENGIAKDYHFTDRKCYPKLQEANALEEKIEGPIAKQVLQRYGYYCGAGFPDGYGPFYINAPEPIDSVDYCCRLHDAQTWANLGDHSNECGMVMCLYHATVWPDGIQSQLADVEESRQHWYGGAATACPGNQSNNAPPYVAQP